MLPIVGEWQSAAFCIPLLLTKVEPAKISLGRSISLLHVPYFYSKANKIGFEKLLRKNNQWKLLLDFAIFLASFVFPLLAF